MSKRGFSCAQGHHGLHLARVARFETIVQAFQHGKRRVDIKSLNPVIPTISVGQAVPDGHERLFDCHAQ